MMSATATGSALELGASRTDGELVASALRGREDGFAELVRRYQRPISAYVYRMIGDYDSSLDLTQEVFIKVYNSLAKFSPEYKFSTWIYKIAHNAAIDHLRRTSTRERALVWESEGVSFELPIESKALTPEQLTEKRERRDEIEAVIRILPPAQRELIILRHSNDLSYDEIAEVTGLPLGTVKNRLFRAREFMRQHFLNRGITGI
jgi:RNA polymerase sigma-70 factor (ECF subfamily)